MDMFPRHKLIYLICGLYAALFATITFCLTLPDVGLSNAQSSPDRWLGWITYFAIESFGSICVALFWSFVTSSTSATSAKKGYPLIVTGGQIGSILGPSLATQSAYFSIPNLFLIAVLEISLVLALTFYYMGTIGQAEIASREEGGDETVKKKSTGLLIGLKLLLTQKYLLGIFGIS